MPGQIKKKKKKKGNDPSCNICSGYALLYSLSKVGLCVWRKVCIRTYTSTKIDFETLRI